MLRLLAITLLLYEEFDEINAIQNVTITKEIILLQPYSTTIANASHILTISSNQTHLQVNSTDEHFKSCIVAVDPIEHSLQGKIRAKPSGNKIIAWAIHAKYEKDSTTKVNYTILIIDPLQCNYKAVSTLEESLAPYWPNKKNRTQSVVGPDHCSYKPVSTVELLPHYWFETGNHLPQVVARDRDSFDVFYPSLTICAPCRYSIDGGRIHLERQIKPDTEQLALFSQIEAYDSLELKHGYFYANSFRNESAVVKLLDQDFNVVKQTFFNHTVDVATVSAGTPANISICYMTSRPFPYHSYIFGSNGKSANHIFCERFNDNFESQFSTELILPDKVEPRAITLEIDSSRNSFVTVQSSNLNQEDIFTVYHLNSSGVLVSTFDLAVQVKNTSSEVWNIRTFLTDDQYCLEITRQFSNVTLPVDSGRVKCITI